MGDDAFPVCVHSVFGCIFIPALVNGHTFVHFSALFHLVMFGFMQFLLINLFQNLSEIPKLLL